MKHPFAAIFPAYTAGLLLAWWFMETEWPSPPLAGLFGVALLVAGLCLFWERERPLLLWILLVLAGWTNLAWRMAPLAPDDLRAVVGSRAELATVRGRLVETPTYRVGAPHKKPVQARTRTNNRTPEANPSEGNARGDNSLGDNSSATASHDSWHTLVVIEVAEIQISNRWQHASGYVLATAPFPLDDDYYGGCRVEVGGVVQLPKGPAAEGLFDYRSYLKWLGIYYQLRTDSAGDWRIVSAPPRRPVADRFFNWAQATLARGLPGEDESLRLLWAMNLGWKTALTNEVSEPYMRTGTMHIFAISGLHIALIAGVLVSLLRVLQVSRFYCGAVVIPLIWFYTGVTGWQSSAIRSALMMTLVIGGWSLKRPGNLLNSLAAAGVLLLWWDPRQLFQAGFQLSFFVVLSMALLTPPLEQWRDQWLRGDPLLPADLHPRWRRALDRPARWLTTSLATSLAACLGSMLIIAYYFHLVTPVSLLANLLIVPLSGLALMCNLGGLCCGGWLPWVTELFNHSAWFWMFLLAKINHWMASLPGGSFYVVAPATEDFICYYLAVFGLFSGWLWRSKHRYWLWTSLGIYALWTGWRVYASAQVTRLEILAVSGGDAIWLENPPRGGDLLIDGGDERSAGYVTKPYLAARGVNRLPTQVITHGDLRHYGATPLLSDVFRTHRIVIGPSRFRSSGYRNLLSDLNGAPGLMKTATAGETIAGFEVLHPRASDRFAAADDAALVLRNTIQGTRLLFCSDLGVAGQKALMERHEDLRADIVVAGIPTKGEPLCDELLDRIRPRLIILSVSDYPANEQAKPALRERLEKRRVPVIYTGDTGSVTVEWRGGDWTLRTMSGLRVMSTHGT